MLLSIILPTYQEAENIPAVCASIASALHESKIKDYEILIMDDCSRDGSDRQAKKLNQKGIPVQFIERKDKQRGLSAAVLDGLKLSQGKYCCVMDADMSHPAEAIAPMLAKLQNDEADFCLGSRYVMGGRIDENWTFRRFLLSRAATFLALPLIKVKDPMSGFFMLARQSLPPLAKLSPLGYKIALELLIKGRYERVYEYPIYFRNRLHGQSKMNIREQFLYLQHLRRLYKVQYPILSEFAHFGLVGGSGFFVDVLLYYGLQHAFSMNHIWARALSFWGAASWNWYWNRVITFSDYFKSMPLYQWLGFIAVSGFGFVLNWGTYAVLTSYVSFFATHKIFALLLGVAAGLGLNFMFSRVLVFRHLDHEAG